MKIKKIISLLLAVIMITALPVTSFAASTSDIYRVYANGIRVTQDNCDDVLGDGGSVKYDKKNHKSKPICGNELVWFAN